ncbi:MAG: caspase family protein [Pseudomonadota bacterium]
MSTSVLAEVRLALVIGNGNYSTVTPLANPVADATLMADRLGDLGFEVTLLTDADLPTLSRGVAAFGRSLRDAGSDATGLFYYAGHGVQSFGSNYLLPTDAALTDAADLDFVALEAQTVLRQMFSARNRTNIVILDACRDNPFDSIPEFGDNGLAEMKAPTGTFLAYATAPGEVAYDGAGDHSPFTAALAEEIATPGAKIEEVFRNVRIRVLEETGRRQTPWDTSSLTEAFSFAPQSEQTIEELAAERAWTSVQGTDDPVQLMMFLRAYPQSPYAPDARQRIEALMDEQLGTPATPEPDAPGPDAAEEALIAVARASGAVEDYQAYLDAFPNGVFAEFAHSELASLVAAAAPAPAAVEPTQEPTTPVPSEAAPEQTAGPLTFDSPLGGSDPEIAALAISDLINMPPRFPPIDGLPEELWKGQTCSGCHAWTQEALCTQAQTYVAQRSLTKQHPFGGAFKQGLRVWAEDGCN